MINKTDKIELSSNGLCSKKEHCDYFELMLTISKDILSSLDIKGITHSLYRNLNLVLDAPLFAVGLFNEEQNSLDFWGVNDCNDALRIGSLPVIDEKIWSISCFLNQTEIVQNDIIQNSEMNFSRLLFSYANEDRKSFVYLPLTSNTRRIGVLTVQSFERNAFEPVQLTFLRSLANYITIAIEKAQAFKKIEEQKLEIEAKSIGLEATLNNLEEIVSLRTYELSAQKEELTRQSEYLADLNKELERLSIVARETDNAIMIMNAAGDIQWVNDCFTRIYGDTLETFIARRGSNIRQTSFCTDISKLLDECILGKHSVFYQALNISSNNREVWTQTSLTPIINDEGEIQHLVAIDTDISKIKEAEKQIVEQADNITQSIRYASKIQRSILPSTDGFLQLFKDSFIFFKPRDIVSGDFYWYHKQECRTWIMAADCTGHGVPGALLSILGISLLDEITRLHPFASAGEVLGLLRANLKKALIQSNNTVISDGMDAALVIIEHRQQTIQYAGAFNPLLLIRKGEKIEFHPDKMPIGEHVKQVKDFNTQRFEYQTGDMIYLFSDGFASQFGGPSYRKFMRRHMYDLLLANSHKPMNEQRENLAQTLEDWKGTNNQIDDILVMGIRLTGTETC